MKSRQQQREDVGGREPVHNLTVRLGQEQAETLRKVAEIDKVPINQAIREAIDSHIAGRRSDPRFRERLDAIIESDKRILERLRG